MKNILIFSCYLPAKKYGGPLKSIYNLVESTYEKANYFLVSLDHDFREKEKLEGIKEGWNKVGHANVIYINEKDFSKKIIMSIFEETKCDLVYLSSVFYWQFNFPACSVAKKLHIPVLLAPRSDLLPNCIKHKKYKKLPYIKLVNFIGIYKDVYYHSTSLDETNSIIKWMRTNDNRIFELPNIASVPLNVDRVEKKAAKLSLIYCGRIHPRKNLKYAIETLKNVKSDVTLDIFGSMEDQNYWNECCEIISNLPQNVRVNYCGNLSPLDVQKKYYEHDALLFPTLNENYGHVIVEAMISGCVPIISKGTTPWDVCDKYGGFVCDLNDIQSFSKAIDFLADEDNLDFKKRLKLLNEFSASNFNNNALSKKYLDIFEFIQEDY